MATNEEMAALKVREALLYMAPDDDAKRDLLKDYEEVLHEEGESEVLKSMTCALADGVLYGNWPWVVKAMNARKD